MKNKFVAYGLYLILFIVIWNLLEFLYSAFITRSGYQFGAGTDLFIPLVVAAASGYILFLRKK